MASEPTQADPRDPALSPTPVAATPAASGPGTSAPEVPTGVEPWQSTAAIDAVLDAMAADLLALFAARGIAQPLLVGIHTGGVWVAERLHQRLGISEPLGHLDISFYRDDFTRIGLHPQVRPSQLPVPVDDRHICLVDDVLQSGRTIRAALNVLFDYGRPASVLLAILARRDGRELPIEPDVVGLHVRLAAGEELKLTGPAPLALVRGRRGTGSSPIAPVSATGDGTRVDQGGDG